MAASGVTPLRYKPTEREQECLDKVDLRIAEAMRWHRSFAQRVELRYSAWRAMAPENAPKSWRSQLHPPHLISIVEGMISSMEEQNPTWLVRGRAVPGMELAEAVAQQERAELATHLLTHQMRVDKFAGKQRGWIQQDLIAGMTPGKVSWLRDERTRKFNRNQRQMVWDDAGGTIDYANVLEEGSEKIVMRDDPTFEPRDVRDFLYPESATELQKAPWILDRTFVSYDTVERMEAMGIYRNCKYLKETRRDESDRTTSGPDVVAEREQRLRNVDRTRGLVEIVEMWTDNHLVTVGNRSVVLRDEPNPFWHGAKPFVVCSAIPDVFQIPGLSVIEGLAQMQEMLWTLANLRIDATRMLANVITLIRGDVENADDYEWAPNAQWIVNDPNQVKLLEPNPAAATITLQSEALLKGDIQNLMGGLPFSGGADSQTIDQSTATGVSIVTNIAQQILAGRKAQYMRAYGRIGEMFLQLDQQFIRRPRLIEILGEEGATLYTQLEGPESIDGIFDVEAEMVGDSMMRQEKRAESGALLTQAAQSAQLMQQLGVPLNMRRFWEKHLDAYDIVDKATFFGQPTQQPQQAADGPPEGPPTPPGAEGILDEMSGQPDPGGITNAALAAGPSSPSSPVTMSATAPMQQALASVGAGRSV